MSKANLLMCLCVLFASTVNAAGERAVPGRVQRPDGVSCVEQAADGDSALGQAYHSCVVQADKHGIAVDLRGEFISSCMTHQPATASDRISARERSCDAKADAGQLAGDRRRAFVYACLAGSRAPEFARVADSSAAFHRRETW